MTAYETALEAHNKAFRAYTVVRDGYRARAVDDATFCAARKVYDAASAEYDVAFARAQEGA